MTTIFKTALLGSLVIALSSLPDGVGALKCIDCKSKALTGSDIRACELGNLKFANFACPAEADICIYTDTTDATTGRSVVRSCAAKPSWVTNNCCTIGTPIYNCYCSDDNCNSESSPNLSLPSDYTNCPPDPSISGTSSRPITLPVPVVRPQNNTTATGMSAATETETIPPTVVVCRCGKNSLRGWPLSTILLISSAIFLIVFSFDNSHY